MTNEKLQRAKYLEEEINKLEYFIVCSEGRWTGKIIKQTQRYIFKANACGAKDDCEYFLDNALKDKLLVVLKEQLNDMKEELKTI